MATYLELFAIKGNSDLQDKVSVAIAKKAQLLIDGVTPTAAQIAWANSAISSPQEKRDALLNYILAKNSTLTTAQITAASDADIQAQVDPAVDALIAGGA